MWELLLELPELLGLGVVVFAHLTGTALLAVYGEVRFLVGRIGR